MIEAVSQVTGKVISADTTFEINESETNLTTGSSEGSLETPRSASTESWRSNISSKTRGVVSDYQVLEANETPGGRWRVSTRVTINRFKAPKRSKRKSLAVHEFRISGDRSPGTAGTLAREIGASARRFAVRDLTRSRKFTVLDRAYTDAQEKELAHMESGKVPIDQLVRLGQQRAADYVLGATLSNFRVREHQSAIIQRRELQRVQATLSFRVVDVATSQVAFAGSHPLVGIISDGQFEGATEAAGAHIAREILDAIYPPLIVEVDVEQETVIVAEGGTNLKIGDTLTVFHRSGSVLRDPYTKEALGFKETEIGKIRMTRLTSKLAYADVLSGIDQIRKKFKSRALACKPDKQAPETAPTTSLSTTLESDW
ncbi:MAG: CsgG/HfaB family protein [Planctomycetota bacterium]